MKRTSRSSVQRTIIFFGVVAISGLLALPAMAEVPVTMTQQGRIMDGDEPMTDVHTMEFSLYDTASDGNLLWSDEIDADLGDDGVYTVVLGGDDNPIDATILQDGEVYLQLTVNGDEFGDRLELTSVPFAAMADSAQIAESVVDGGVSADSIADGAVGSSALADGAVGSEQVDTIDWDQLTGIPAEIIEPSDTLADLDCDSDHVAVYDGSEWHCAMQQDTTYTAGDGLELDDDEDEFSVAENRFLECDDESDACPVGVEEGIYLDGDTDGDFLIYADDGFMGLGGGIRFARNLGVEERANFEDRVGIQTAAGLAPQFPLHIRQEEDDDIENAAIGMFHDDGSEGWTVGTASTNNFHFRYSDHFVQDDFERMAWISRQTGEFYATSDINLKTDIEYVDGILDDVMHLEPATYRFKRQDRDADRSYGFIAQEVAEVFPEVVTKEEGDYGMAYSNFGVLAIQAIREQQEIIDEQEERLEDLEERISQLEAQ